MYEPFTYCPTCRAPLRTVERNGRERRVCSAPECGFVFWGNPDPVVAAIVECQDQVLLVQNIGWPAHWFGLVTGFLECDEHPQDAVLREVREEVGLAGKVTGLVGMYPFGRRNQIIIAYHVVVAGLDVVKQEDEIADYRWVPLAKLVPWNAATGLALHDWMRSRGYDRAPVRFGDHLPSP